MMNQRETRLFEIPIYGINEERYQAKHKLAAAKFANNSLTLLRCENVEAEKDRLRDIYFECEYKSFEYNQIVGYIVIGINAMDLFFTLYLSDKRYRFNAMRVERSIKKIVRPGNHVYIGSSKTNDDIATIIKRWLHLEVVELNKKHKNYYVDTTALDNIVNDLDYLSIIKREDVFRE